MFGKILRQGRKINLGDGVISRSMCMGMVVGFSPTVGLQLVICFILAQLCNRLWRPNTFNTVIALIGSLVVNPFTMVPTYTFYYWVGCRMTTCTTDIRFEDAGAISDLIWKLGEGTWAIFLGSVPFMVVGLPGGYHLGRLIERVLEARANCKREKLVERARERRRQEVEAAQTAD
jgi:uncharacterized protein (DUF2062 family)